MCMLACSSVAKLGKSLDRQHKIQAQMPELQGSMWSITAFLPELHGPVQEGNDAPYGGLQLWHLNLYLVLLIQQLPVSATNSVG